MALGDFSHIQERSEKQERLDWLISANPLDVLPEGMYQNLIDIKGHDSLVKEGESRRKIEIKKIIKELN